MSISNNILITKKEQLLFSKLSGDYNPIHIDPIEARRLLFGTTIIHGIHGALSGIDFWLMDLKKNIVINSLNINFKKPIRTKDKINLSISNLESKKTLIELSVFNQLSTSIEILWEYNSTKEVFYKDGIIPLEKPLTPKKEEIPNLDGFLDLYLNKGLLDEILPNVSNYLDPNQISCLLATTRLVGMKNPGLNSLFSQLFLEKVENNLLDRRLIYKVNNFDSRFGLIEQSISAPKMEGHIECFLRPEKQQQIEIKNLNKNLKQKNYDGQKAMIIGGSRGIGEVVAKLLAAGGGECLITYLNGKEDAQNLVEEIESFGGKAKLTRLNILALKNDLEKILDGFCPTHVFYFATPFIEEGNKGDFSSELFHNFCNYYVDSFIKIVHKLSDLGINKIFYPSTIFIDEPSENFKEYIISKKSGELACNLLTKQYINLEIYKPRLPKMKTDQNVGIMPSTIPSGEEVMKDFLEEFMKS